MPPTLQIIRDRQKLCRLYLKHLQCGKMTNIAWLISQGYAVILADGCPVAVEYKGEYTYDI